MRNQFLLSLFAAFTVSAVMLAGCGSSSGTQSSEAEEYSSEPENSTLDPDSAADGGTEDSVLSRSIAGIAGGKSLAGKAAMAATEGEEEADLKEIPAESEEETNLDVDDLDEWDMAEYTYHLGTREEWEWLDADDGIGTTMNMNLQYLVIEQEYDEYGNEIPAEEGTSGVEKAIEDINNRITDDNEAFRSEYKEDAQERYDELKDSEDYYYSGYANEETLTISRADSHCLSVVRDHYINLSGAHGYTETTAYTYDAKTGQRLKVTDFVTSRDPLASLITMKLLKTHESMEFNNVSEDSPETDLLIAIQKLMQGDEYYEGDNDLHYVTWYPVSGGMKFVFNQYDLGPYAAGQFVCTLMAEDYPDLFQDEYLYGPDNYAEKISLYEGYNVDGKELLIGENETDEYSIDAVYVDYGEEHLEIEVWGYGVKAYLMTVPAGKYLYLDVTTDNDWHNIYVVELGGRKLEAIEIQGLGFSSDPLDPDHVMLETRTEALSSFSIKRSYHLDAASGGELLPNEKMFQVIKYDENSPVFTLKQDAELKILDDLETGATHTEKIKKGTTMEMIRTDNESISDCMTEDGKTIRFTIDMSEWPFRIDGKYDVEDLLDGTIFVG